MIIGPLRKLAPEVQNDSSVHYHLPIADERIAVNQLLNSRIKIEYLLEINCIQCDRKTSKSFQQGYCYPCYSKLLDCNLCIIHPERCKHHHEACPDTWEHEHCKQTHIVYLANSSGLKVGITRDSNRINRWLDQGAIQAIPILKVSNRYVSGQFEVLLKQHVADKTNWRKMLSNDVIKLDLASIKKEILQKAQCEIKALSDQLGGVELLEDPPHTFQYPVFNFPAKLNQFNLDKNNTVEGELLGIKGQYLIFDSGVFNVRKHAGYRVSFESC